MDLRPEVGFSGKIGAILLGFGPICLDLGHFAKIWAILHGFGLFGRIWVTGNKALRMGQEDSWTDGQNPPVFYRTSSPLGPLPKSNGSCILRRSETQRASGTTENADEKKINESGREKVRG